MSIPSVERSLAPLLRSTESQFRRNACGHFPGPGAGIIRNRRGCPPDMATSPRPASLLVRLDSRLRAGLQQQIYGSIRRAILDGVVVPGGRLPSSRALAADLGVSRTTTLLALQQLQAEGYLAAR